MNEMCTEKFLYCFKKFCPARIFFPFFPLTCSTDFLVSVSLCTCCEPPSGRWQGVMKDSRSCECSSVKLVLGEKERTPASSSDSFVGVKCLFLLYLCFSFARELQLVSLQYSCLLRPLTHGRKSFMFFLLRLMSSSVFEVVNKMG